MAYGGRFQHGALPHLEFVGEESLLDYLIGIQVATMTLERRTDRAREWLLEIHSAEHLSLNNTLFSEEQYKVFRPAC